LNSSTTGIQCNNNSRTCTIDPPRFGPFDRLPGTLQSVICALSFPENQN